MHYEPTYASLLIISLILNTKPVGSGIGLPALASWQDVQAWAPQLFALGYHTERQLNAPEEESDSPDDIDILGLAPFAASVRCVRSCLAFARAPLKRLERLTVFFLLSCFSFSALGAAQDSVGELRFTTWQEAPLNSPPACIRKV